jgi:hypothetical protein
VKRVPQHLPSYRIATVAAIWAALVASSPADSNLFQPGTTLRNVVIPRYSATMEREGILRFSCIRVQESGEVLADRFAAEFGEDATGKSFLRAGAAMMPRNLDSISTAGGTELKLNGIHLETEGLEGDLSALNFSSRGGFRLSCSPSTLPAAGPLAPLDARRPKWRSKLSALPCSRGPLVEPRGPGSPFWFDDRFDLGWQFHAGESPDPASATHVRMLSKGSGSFHLKEGIYSSRGGCLLRFSLGWIACGDKFEVTWGLAPSSPGASISKVMPPEIKRLRADGGCHVRAIDSRGRRFLIICQEVKYSGKTGLISLQGGYPRILSAEGQLHASEKHQYLRINAAGRLTLGPGHWESGNEL